jgi:hypothetical protein
MYPPSADQTFAESIAGVLFPRTSVGAASFWNFQPGLAPNSTGFRGAMEAQNGRLAARGLDTCPNGCACEILSRCGKPY